MRRRLKAKIVMFVAITSTLTACGASDHLPAGELADQVAATIEERVGVRADVDCGDARVSAASGTTVRCEATDPEIGATYFASVEIVNTDGRGGYELELSVDPADQTKQHDEGNDS